MNELELFVGRIDVYNKILPFNDKERQRKLFKTGPCSRNLCEVNIICLKVSARRYVLLVIWFISHIILDHKLQSITPEFCLSAILNTSLTEEMYRL